MEGGRRLVITLAVEVNVPASGLDFNSLVSAFEKYGELSTGLLFTTALTAIESDLGERLRDEHPGRFSWDGHHGKAKRWTLPFGDVSHRYRRLRDRETGRHVVPLRDGLSIPLRKRFTWAVLAGPVGLASELSFRRAAREGRRLQNGRGPSKSTNWEYFQKFAAAGVDPTPPTPERTLEVALADGTKLKRQRRGANEGLMDMRIVCSQSRAGKGFQVAAFDLDVEWPVLKARLRRELPEHQIGVLITDGEEGIESLCDGRTRLQRCLVHLPRGLRWALYMDKLKQRRQRPIFEKLFTAKAWRMNADALAALPGRSRYHLRELIDQAKGVCDEILEMLPQKAQRARGYVERFKSDGLSFLRALLNDEPPLPGVTTNPMENVFSQMDTRLKEIGRRWSLEGASSMLRVLLTKIFRPEWWDRHLDTLRRSATAVTIEVKLLDQRWVHDFSNT